jgi:quercetin dioxygenase-like cupin family protein
MTSLTRSLTKFGLPALAILAGAAIALAPLGSHAQQAPAAGGGGGGRGPAAPHGPHEFMDATVKDPPGALPDPSRIVLLLPNQIKWTGNKALVYGDPTKPGDPYGVIVRLAPGQFSAPHSIANDRWVYVVSGTLWVSDSNAAASYPVKADNFVTNVAKTRFVDGNRAGATEPTVLMITGVGSADNRIMSDYSTMTSVKASDPAGTAPNTASITITPVSLTGNQNLYGGGQGAQTEGTPYGVIQTWTPGRYSSPHYHPHPRYIYVLSGTWWATSSSLHDTRLTYPIPAGSFVQDLPKGIHWDGNRMGDPQTTRLYISGVAPASNVAVDEDGKERVAPGGRGGYN